MDSGMNDLSILLLYQDYICQPRGIPYLPDETGPDQLVDFRFDLR